MRFHGHRPPRRPLWRRHFQHHLHLHCHLRLPTPRVCLDSPQHNTARGQLRHHLIRYAPNLLFNISERPGRLDPASLAYNTSVEDKDGDAQENTGLRRYSTRLIVRSLPGIACPLSLMKYRGLTPLCFPEPRLRPSCAFHTRTVSSTIASISTPSSPLRCGQPSR